METQARLAPGTVLGNHYELGSPIHSMGGTVSYVTTYSARHRMLSRPVAVKVLSLPEEAERRDELSQRFLREARAAGGLDHPNVLRIYDVGVAPMTPPVLYMVTDLPPGLTLRNHLRLHGPFKRPRALRLVIDCLDGLAEAHAQGIVHRNLKPSSLFLANPGTDKERLMVTNFGLAMIEANYRARKPDRIMGTPRYLAPELISGGEVGPTVDVYQMGLVLVEMLAGQPAVLAQNDMACIRAHLQGELTISQELNIGEFGDAVQKSLAREPSRRYADAKVFAEALGRFARARAPRRSFEPTVRGALPGGALLDGIFEVGEEIGRGGFAIVYEGVQKGIDRPVAIKVLTEQPEARRQQEYEARFMREAQAAASIDHPNVVTIHHFGLVESTRQPYMVMELLKGHTLEEVLEREGAMSVERAFSLVGGCLEALGEAHKKGIVHKDLKPSNLFIASGRRGREVMKITDFGVARVLDKGQLTRAGTPVCTLGYAAPEYLQELIVKPALDVYQMGLVLIEMLTGWPVVDDDTPTMCIMRHLSGQLTIPPEILSGPLGPVLRKALATGYRERYPDADAFLDALDALDPTQIRFD